MSGRSLFKVRHCEIMRGCTTVSEYNTVSGRLVVEARHREILRWCTEVSEYDAQKFCIILRLEFMRGKVEYQVTIVPMGALQLIVIERLSKNVN